MGQYYSLNYSQLDTILKDIKNTTLDYFPYFQEAFVLLYETGCRVGELFEISRWRRINDTTLGLTPQKYNSERIIVIPSGVTLFPQWVDNQVTPWYGLSVVQLNALFMRFSPYTSYLAETKPISLYLFRYRYIRYLASNGWSLADIQTIMGYSSQTVIHNYLNSALSYYSETPVYPVVSVGSQTWLSPSYNLNDGGIGIYAPSNNVNLVAVYGYLFTSEAALRVASSLVGFRVPTQQDFNTLVSYLGGDAIAGGALKQTGFVSWLSPNTGASNSSGLSLAGSGQRSPSGSYSGLQNFCTLQTAPIPPNTSHYTMSASYYTSALSFATRLNTYAHSLRLIKV